MNLILFERTETLVPLPLNDRRAIHIREVLRRTPGDSFDCGIIEGPRGKARVEREENGRLHLSFAWLEEPPCTEPITMLVGLCRPQTVRKILREVTSLGVAKLVFFQSDRGEPSYASSSLWQGNEVHRHLVSGAEQAFCTRLPKVDRANHLASAIEKIGDSGDRFALDNYEAEIGLMAAPFEKGPQKTLAIGSERGWTADERDQLRRAGFRLVHLGNRVLRTETACVAGLSLLRAKLGLLD